MDKLWRSIYRMLCAVFAVAALTATDAMAQRGNGSERSPFRLSTTDDLISFRKSINEGVSFRGVELGEGAEDFYFVLDADIDLNSNHLVRKEGWTGIGTETHPFKGSFDGGGYVVKCVNKKGSKERVTRLFGNVENAKLRNVFVYMDMPSDGSNNVYASERGSCIYNCVNADSLPNKMIQYFQGEYKLTDFDYRNIQGYEDGTEAHPFVIRDETDLLTMSRCVNGGTPFHGAELKPGGKGQVFVLKENLDMGKLEVSSVYRWQPIGTPNMPFAGTFYGNGKVISNLRSKKKGGTHLGLFGYTDGARIYNVRVKGADLEADYNVGIIAGCAANSVIMGCNVSGAVRGERWIGGVCGEVFNTMVKECEAENCKVTASEGSFSIGGIVGIASQQSTIFACKAATEVCGSYDVGEICGSNEESNIYRCLSSSTVHNIADARTAHLANDLDMDLFSLGGGSEQ